MKVREEEKEDLSSFAHQIVENEKDTEMDLSDMEISIPSEHTTT